MSEHPTPTQRARTLVEGAYDTHIHVAPDVMRRRIDDLSLARRFAEVGLAGFVLKSHYIPTAERAAVVRAAVPGVDVLGSLTLNGSVGGMNPTAVEIAARSGARVVWFPTVDSANQRASRAQAPADSTPPMWAALQDDLRALGIYPPAIDVVGGAGDVLPDVEAVLTLIARHDLVLATGHLAAAEILAVTRRAVELGVQRIVITHPEFTSQRLSVADQRELVEYGALLERCFTTPYTGKVAWRDMVENIKKVGTEHSVLSSDLGQPFNPPVEDGIALMADWLLADGFSEDEVHTMTVVNSSRLAAAPVATAAGE
ncbi:MAG: DUF6282 family protein [Nocardioides sp.]|uniref:DUF6282 family protein n=1 Tax=Nocardioides sp. TaxID=35761 RepID=UPI0039E393D6